jgi:hypothetical protein
VLVRLSAARVDRSTGVGSLLGHVQLSVEVVAPARDCAGGVDAAGVKCSGAEGDEVAVAE